MPAVPATPHSFQGLVVIANPSDLPPFDVERAWASLVAAVAPLARVHLERLSSPTDAALRDALARSPCDVLHLIAHTRAHPSARYHTIALQGSDGRSRNITPVYLAGLLAQHPSLRTVVLQACSGTDSSLASVAEALAEMRISTVVVPAGFNASEQRAFCARLYAGLAPDPVTAFPAPPPPPAADPPTWQAEIERKRLASAFDVFLCHNSADKPAVRLIAQRLKEKGLLPWLDILELPPGQPWQRLLEQQIGSIKAAAVFVGSSGIGPWQEQEMDAWLREFVDRRCPVIPVLLADAPLRPDLPRFLRALTWVDFRCPDPDPLAQLIWGITGNHPPD